MFSAAFLLGFIQFVKLGSLRQVWTQEFHSGIFCFDQHVCVEKETAFFIMLVLRLLRILQSIDYIVLLILLVLILMLL